MPHIWLVTYKLYIPFESIFYANFKNIVFDFNSPTQNFKTRFPLECVGWTSILTSNSDKHTIPRRMMYIDKGPFDSLSKIDDF